jgi:riboflavin kinase / FMN adenylyltransferase
MKIVDDIRKYRGKRRTSVAIGVFDGVHTGHRRVISRAVERAGSLNAEAAVLTFRDPPKFSRHARPKMLTSFEHKLRIIERLGCRKAYVVAGKDKWFFDMTAEEFFHKIIREKLNCASVSVGENFFLGRGGKTHISELQPLFDRHGILLDLSGIARVGNRVVSSSVIKKHIERSAFSAAAKLLGRRYSIGGRVRKGLGIGKSIGIRTANIDVSDEAVPMEGVFASCVTLEGEKKIYGGALSIGSNPTVNRDSRQKIEVHILNFRKSIIGRFMEIYPIRKIRKTRKFKDLAELKDQMLRDIEKIKEVLNSNYLKISMLQK